MWLAIITSCNKEYPSVYNVYTEQSDLIEFMDDNLVITEKNKFEKTFLNSNDANQNDGDQNDDADQRKQCDDSDDSDDSDEVSGPIINMPICYYLKYEHYKIKNYDEFDCKECLRNHFEHCGTGCSPIVTIIEMDNVYTVCEIMNSVQCL